MHRRRISIYRIWCILEFT